MQQHHRAALVSIVLLLPFWALNAVIALRFEPLFSLIRPGENTSMAEYALLALSMLLYPIALFVVVRPLLDRSGRGPRKLYLANIALSIAILFLTVLLWGAFSEELVSCEVLGTANCD